MEILRVVVTGTVGAGKTSFIRTISEIEVVDTDRRATDEIALLKRDTTVAFDFGRLTIGPEQAMHLYGTPGQSRFDFMWDILIRKAHAYVLLVNAHRPQDLRNGRRILSFMSQRAQIPMIIGLSHMDFPNAWAPDNIALALGLLDEKKRPPLVCLDATNQESVSHALIALIQEMLTTPVLQQH
ncbi:ATP/GTP-binding protein [Pseudanabaena sp. FACHB-2040]|uniref:GTP-binding protein n=1 Tax=Pseudanabaena sp. FACHB-2040 TaxID=2692859 RepID=UPI00168811EA|nr:ATP/GTP-binding protein [Pseudanabaena sp. FACHB-2040]MBD2256091.1 ATP/GTP-binding protein [Pseudanabaena sp. FACHB-2040]